MPEPTVTITLPASEADLLTQLLEIVNNHKSTSAKSTSKAADTKKTSSKSDAAEEDLDDDDQDDEVVTVAQFKANAKKAKEEHGQDFVMQVLEDSGFKKRTLVETLKSVPTKSYSLISKLWAMGEVEEDGFDDDDDDQDQAEVTAEAVITAIKAHAKEHGKLESKKIMKAHKVNLISEVNNLSSDKLAALLEDLV